LRAIFPAIPRFLSANYEKCRKTASISQSGGKSGSKKRYATKREESYKQWAKAHSERPEGSAIKALVTKLVTQARMPDDDTCGCPVHRQRAIALTISVAAATCAKAGPAYPAAPSAPNSLRRDSAFRASLFLSIAPLADFVDHSGTRPKGKVKHVSNVRFAPIAAIRQNATGLAGSRPSDGYDFARLMELSVKPSWLTDRLIGAEVVSSLGRKPAQAGRHFDEWLLLAQSGTLEHV